MTPYLLAASICTNLIADGGPGWLNLLTLLFLWDAMKLAIMGPISLILLARVRIREAVARSRARGQQSVGDHAAADLAYAGAGVTR